MFWQLIDGTYKRFDENTKIIVVDGNIAVGKTDFAKKLAKEFDMKYVADATDDDVFTVEGDFDMRYFNEQLPPRMRYCDVESFYRHDSHPDFLKGFCRTQFEWFKMSYQVYRNAVEHLLNTGQGIVFDRCAFSHNVFHRTFAKMGYLSKNAMKYMQMSHDTTVCDLLRPHLVVYLDAPIDFVKEKIKQRNNDWEVKSPVYTDEFLTTLDQTHKQSYFPYMKKYGEIITFDASDLPEWDMIVDDMERVDLETKDFDDEDKFKDWQLYGTDYFDYHRAMFSDDRQMLKLFSMIQPWDAPELMIEQDDVPTYNYVIKRHPRIRFAKGYDPAQYNVMFKLR